MFCGKCGAPISDGGKFCPSCGAPNENATETKVEQKEEVISTEQVVKQEEPIPPVKVEEKKLKDNKKVWIGGIVLVLVIGVVIGFMFFLKKPQRAKTLMNLEKDPYLKFTLNGEDFYLGETASFYQQKGYTFEDDFFQEDDKISKDSILVHPIYHEEEDQFLGALYCAKDEDCAYQDSILVKANFYENSDVVINDFIKFGMKYEDIVEKYGKEDGKFYQGNHSFVWTFGEKGKIGEPYYILTFDDSFLSDMGDLIDIRIGVWWYDGEYEHTVVKE